MSTDRCAACGSDGKGRGGLVGIGGCILCDQCTWDYRMSLHSPEHGGRGLGAWLREKRTKV